MAERAKKIVSKLPRKVKLPHRPATPVFAETITFESFVHRQQVPNPLSLNGFLFAAWGNQDSLLIIDTNFWGFPWPAIGMSIPASGLLIQLPGPSKLFTLSLIPDPPPTAPKQFVVDWYDQNGEWINSESFSGRPSHQPTTILIEEKEKQIGVVGVSSSVETVLCRVQSLSC